MSNELNSELVFKTLYEALRETYRDTLDTGLKISGSVVLVLGWFAAQKNPLPFLCPDTPLKWLALLLVLVGYVLVCLILRNHYDRSQDVYRELSKRGFDTSLYLRLRITPSMLYGGLVGHALMLGGVAWSIFYKYDVTVEFTCKVS